MNAGTAGEGAAECSAPGLYIHVPFCARVCPYCDFAVQTGGPAKRRAYVGALLREIESWGKGAARPDGTGAGPRLPAGAFDTIYFGGGTPSALDPQDLTTILDAVCDHLPVAAGAEICLEANPEDVTEERLAAWRESGFQRLSIGAQSFFTPALALLGRTHTVGQGGRAVRLAREAGFTAVSLDLIFAVPGPVPEAWEASLKTAIDLRPDHISCYELTVHDGTRLFRDRQRGRFTEMNDEAKAEQFFFTHELLADAGYVGYEVSNFARQPQHRSRHNRKYWRHVPYLGLGPSAHSFDGVQRWWNERRLADWMSAVQHAGRAVADRETLAPEQLVLEALALGLRTRDGVDLERVRRRWGIDLRASNVDLIGRLAEDGLLHAGDASLLVPTLEGMAVADSLAAAFEIPAATTASAAAHCGVLSDRAGISSP